MLTKDIKKRTDQQDKAWLWVSRVGGVIGIVFTLSGGIYGLGFFLTDHKINQLRAKISIEGKNLQTLAILESINTSNHSELLAKVARMDQSLSEYSSKLTDGDPKREKIESYRLALNANLYSVGDDLGYLLYSYPMTNTGLWVEKDIAEIPISPMTWIRRTPRGRLDKVMGYANNMRPILSGSLESDIFDLKLRVLVMQCLTYTIREYRQRIEGSEQAFSLYEIEQSLIKKENALVSPFLDDTDKALFLESARVIYEPNFENYSPKP